MKKIGVHHALNYKNEDFSKAVRRILGESGVDIVLDPVGGPTFKKSYGLLAPGGRIISYGVADLVAGGRKNIFRLLWKFLSIPRVTNLNLIQNNRGVFGLSLNRLISRSDEIRVVMNELLKLFAEGLITPEVSRVYRLEEISQAHEYLESGKSSGKLIIKMTD